MKEQSGGQEGSQDVPHSPATARRAPVFSEHWVGSGGGREVTGGEGASII